MLMVSLIAFGIWYLCEKAKYRREEEMENARLRKQYHHDCEVERLHPGVHLTKWNPYTQKYEW